MRDNMLILDQAALMERFPNLNELPKTHVEIIVLAVAGMLPSTIADYMQLSVQTVRSVLNRYDINTLVKKGWELQRLLISNALSVMAIEGIARLRNKSKELEKMSPSALLAFVKDSIELAEITRPKDSVSKEKESDLLRRLK